MPCALTQGLVLDCRDGAGGVKEVYIMEYDNATTITQASGIVTTITKVTGKKFFKYKLVAFTGDGNEAMTNSRENGTSTVKQTIAFPINKMTVAVRNEIQLLAQNRLIIIYVDNNGSAWLYGKDFGMMLDTAGSKSGKVLADRNGYELSFGSDEKYLAPSVDPATMLTLEVAGT